LLSEPGFTTSSATHDDVTVLSVGGEIDMATAPAFATAIDELLENIPQALIIDLAGVQFIDSAGLTVLMRTHDRRSAVGHFAVVVESVCRRPIELIGLDKLFPVCPTLADALTAVHTPAQ
jgi:anti-sigma B factor antagonist